MIYTSLPIIASNVFAIPKPKPENIEKIEKKKVSGSKILGIAIVFTNLANQLMGNSDHNPPDSVMSLHMQSKLLYI